MSSSAFRTTYSPNPYDMQAHTPLHSSRNLKRRAESISDEDKEPIKRTKHERKPIKGLKESQNHQRRKTPKSKPILFTSARVQKTPEAPSRYRHYQHHPSVSPHFSASSSQAASDGGMVDHVSPDVLQAASQLLSVSKDQEIEFLKAALREKDNEIASWKLRFEQNEQFLKSSQKRELALRAEVNRKNELIHGLEVEVNLKNDLLRKFEVGANSDLVVMTQEELEDKEYTIKYWQRKHEGACRRYQEGESRYEVLEAKYRTLKSMGVNQFSYVVFEGRKTPEIISVNRPDEEYPHRDHISFAEQEAAERQQEHDDWLNGVVKDCDIPIQSIESDEHDEHDEDGEDDVQSFGPSEFVQQSSTGTRSAAPSMTGSPEPVQFVELSVTPKSPYPPNTYESNVQLYSRASIPLHPLPLDYVDDETVSRERIELLRSISR